MKLRNKKELAIWNEAIKMAAKEILKWDGTIPDERERKYVSEGVLKICSRQKISPPTDKNYKR